MIGLLITLLIITIALRVIFNLKIHNKIHYKDPIKPISRPVGIFNSINEIREKDASNIHAMYCFVVMFWLKYPKDKVGRKMANAVWIFSLSHIIIIFLLIHLHSIGYRI